MKLFELSIDEGMIIFAWAVDEPTAVRQCLDLHEVRPASVRELFDATSAPFATEISFSEWPQAIRTLPTMKSYPLG